MSNSGNRDSAEFLLQCCNKTTERPSRSHSLALLPKTPAASYCEAALGPCGLDCVTRPLGFNHVASATPGADRSAGIAPSFDARERQSMAGFLPSYGRRINSANDRLAGVPRAQGKPTEKYGGLDRTRICDLLRVKQAL